jgi:hypothetical protein
VEDIEAGCNQHLESGAYLDPGVKSVLLDDAAAAVASSGGDSITATVPAGTWQVSLLSKVVPVLPAAVPHTCSGAIRGFCTRQHPGNHEGNRSTTERVFGQTLNSNPR